MLTLAFSESSCIDPVAVLKLLDSDSGNREEEKTTPVAREMWSSGKDMVGRLYPRRVVE